MTNPSPSESRCSGVAGVVLAAGSSRRMPGATKQLLPYRQSTVLGTTVGAALAAGLDPVFVVTGHDSERVGRELTGSGTQVVFNAEHGAGVGTSLAAGITAAAKAGAEAVVVLLGDEPAIDPSLIERVVGRWREGGLEAVRVRYLDRPGHPVLLGRGVFQRCAGLRGDESIWDRLVASGLIAQEIPARVTAPADIDRPADYDRSVSGGEDGC